MAINETIKTGRKFRIQLSGSDNVWKRLSFWTKASDVEFDDGTNAQDKLGTLDTDLLTTKNRLDTFESNLSTNLGKIATAITNQGVSTAATATVDTMVNNIATVATNKYNAGVTKGESNIKGSGDKVLTVPQAAYNSSKYNITDGYYTHVDATAVYNKGKTDGTNAGQSSAKLLWAHAGRGDNIQDDNSTSTSGVKYRDSSTATATQAQTVAVHWTVRNWQATTAYVSYFIGSTETTISNAEGVHSGTKNISLSKGQTFKLRCHGQDGANGVDQHCAACCIVF